MQKRRLWDLADTDITAAAPNKLAKLNQLILLLNGFLNSVKTKKDYCDHG